MITIGLVGEFGKEKEIPGDAVCFLIHELQAVLALLPLLKVDVKSGDNWAERE